MDTKALRQKVLDLAIRGKLVPQDPNDEPASVLLERIRQQKQQMVKDGKLKAKDIKNDTIIFVGEDNLHYEKFADGSVKCIEDEIPFDLPDGWAWARIFSIAEDLPYGTAKKSSVSGRIAVLRMGNIQAGEIDYGDLVFSSDNDDIEKYTLKKGDLLFNRTNSAEWVGKTAIYRGNIPAIYAGYLIRLRAFINTEYLNAVMNSGYAKAYYNLVKTDGVNQSNINAKKLGAFLIPIPPFTEQVKIGSKIIEILPAISVIHAEKGHIENFVTQAKAKILDLAIRGQLVPQDPNDEPASVLLERIRTEKEELIRQGKIKRDKKESVIFKGDDNSYYEKIGGKVENISDKIPFELPESWAWCRGYSCFEGMESTKPLGDFFDYIDIDAIDNRLHRIKEAKRLPVSDAPSRASRAVKSGSVLFSLVRPYLENIALIEEKHSQCIASTGFYVCNSNGAFLPEFMFFLMISGYVVGGLNQYIKGDNSPSISKDNIENWLYPVPPIEEQRAICAKLQSVFSLIENVEKSLS